MLTEKIDIGSIVGSRPLSDPVHEWTMYLVKDLGHIIRYHQKHPSSTFLPNGMALRYNKDNDVYYLSSPKEEFLIKRQRLEDEGTLVRDEYNLLRIITRMSHPGINAPEVDGLYIADDAMLYSATKEQVLLIYFKGLLSKLQMKDWLQSGNISNAHVIEWSHEGFEINEGILDFVPQGLNPKVRRNGYAHRGITAETLNIFYSAIHQ